MQRSNELRPSTSDSAEPLNWPDSERIKTRVSVVIPCFNEADVIPTLCHRLGEALRTLGVSWEVILVDDGSTDRTFQLLAEAHLLEPRFKCISLSRNFGHQAAVYVGLQHATGDVVAIMDADLQDPPELLGRCLELLRDGNDVVYAVRRKRKENWFKRTSYAAFYRFMKFAADIEVPVDAGDFCVMRRPVAETLRAMPERNVFLRGMRAWVGFRQVGLVYDRPARAAGQTKYTFRKLVRLAADGVFAFSVMPLRLATYLGLLTVTFCIMTGLFLLSWRLLNFEVMGRTAEQLPGWTAIALGLLAFSGVQLLLLGMIGEYLGRVYNEVKRRPRWVIKASLGVAAESINEDRSGQVQSGPSNIELGAGSRL